MTTRGKRQAGEQEWREMTPRQRRLRPYHAARRGFTLYHFVIAVAALLAVIVVDYLFPNLRGLLQ